MDKLTNLEDIYKQCAAVATIQVSRRIILGWILTSRAEGRNGFLLKMKHRHTSLEKIGFTVQFLQQRCGLEKKKEALSIIKKIHTGRSQVQNKSPYKNKNEEDDGWMQAKIDRTCWSSSWASGKPGPSINSLSYAPFF